MKSDKTEEFNLVTVYGNEIRIITDEDSYDAVYTGIFDALDTNCIYCVGNYGETATFKEHALSVIDLKKIIGIQ